MIYTGRNCRVSWINHSTELLQFKDTLKFTIEYFATFIYGVIDMIGYRRFANKI